MAGSVRIGLVVYGARASSMCVGGSDSSCHVHIVHAAGPVIVSLPAVRSPNQPSSAMSTDDANPQPGTLQLDQQTLEAIIEGVAQKIQGTTRSTGGGSGAGTSREQGEYFGGRRSVLLPLLHSCECETMKGKRTFALLNHGSGAVARSRARMRGSHELHDLPERGQYARAASARQLFGRRPAGGLQSKQGQKCIRWHIASKKYGPE